MLCVLFVQTFFRGGLAAAAQRLNVEYHYHGGEAQEDERSHNVGDALQPRGEYVLVLEGKSLEEKRQEEISSWENMSIEEHMAYYENQVKGITDNTIKLAGNSPKNAVIGISTQSGFAVDSLSKQAQAVLDSGAGIAFFEYETFFSGNYADALKNTALKNTQFNVDKEVYKTDVEREEESESTETPWDDAENPLYGLDIRTSDIILYAVLGIAVIAIVAEGIVLVVGAKKKKNVSK